MRGALPIGRVAGIPLRLHVTFLLLPLLAYWLTLQGTGDSHSALWMSSLTLLLFACVVLHELGHCVAAQGLGARVQGITLLPIGGVAVMANLPEKPAEEIWVALAGPLVNVIITGLLLPWVGVDEAVANWNTIPSSAADLPAALMRANIVLVIFNLIPAFPMDGGRVLRALLAVWMPYAVATSAAARIGRFVAILFVIAGARFSPLLVLVGVFVFIAAGRESAVIAARGRWSGRPVRSLMKPAHAAHPADPLTALLARWHAGEGGDFVLQVDGRVVGLLSRGGLRDGLRSGGGHRPAAEFMVRGFAVVGPDADAGRTLFELGRGAQRVIPVLDGGELLGVLDLEETAAAAPDGGSASPVPGRRIVLG